MSNNHAGLVVFCMLSVFCAGPDRTLWTTLVR